MHREFRRDRRGATAIEFALIFPVLILFLFGAIQMAITLWRWNSLENVAKVVARCAAISSPKCASVTEGCASSDAGICYAVKVAADYGFTDFEASNAVVDYGNIVNSTSFTTVHLSYPTSVLTYSFKLHASASFPNN